MSPQHHKPAKGLKSNYRMEMRHRSLSESNVKQVDSSANVKKFILFAEAENKNKSLLKLHDTLH